MIGNTFYLSKIHSNETNLKAMKYSFYLKTDYINKEGKYPLYLNLYAHSKRKRIPVEIFLKKNDWDPDKQLVKTPELNDYNLLINEIRSQINKIEIQFRLNNFVLTVDKCAELLQKPDLSIDFVAFMAYEMELKSMSKGAKKKSKSNLSEVERI